MAMLRTAHDGTAEDNPYLGTMTKDHGTASFLLDAPVIGKYAVWCRVRALDADHDSFFVGMDNGPEEIYDAAEDRWSKS
jgi:hypothetical protein